MCWAIKNSSILTNAYRSVKTCFKDLMSPYIQIHGGTLCISLKCIQKMKRNGHSFRGNYLYAMTRHHTITLKMVYNLLSNLFINQIESKKAKNGRACFTRTHDLGGYWWPPTYSNWLLVSIFCSTRHSVLLYNCKFYISGAVWIPTHSLGGYGWPLA